jgi:hypothetical protein
MWGMTISCRRIAKPHRQFTPKIYGFRAVFSRPLRLFGNSISNTNRRAKVHKKQPLMTPSFRFPLKSGGTE